MNWKFWTWGKPAPVAPVKKTQTLLDQTGYQSRDTYLDDSPAERMAKARAHPDFVLHPHPLTDPFRAAEQKKKLADPVNEHNPPAFERVSGDSISSAARAERRNKMERVAAERARDRANMVANRK